MDMHGVIYVTHCKLATYKGKGYAGAAKILPVGAASFLDQAQTTCYNQVQRLHERRRVVRYQYNSNSVILSCGIMPGESRSPERRTEYTTDGEADVHTISGTDWQYAIA